MLLWNQQHKRWVDAQMKKQGTFRTGSAEGGEPPDPEWATLRAEQEAKRQARRAAQADPFAPTGKASEVPQTGEPQDEDETWWQDDEDKPRVYEPGQGMAGRGTSTGRAPGAEVGGRYQRSEELRGQTAAEQRGRSRQASDLPGSKNSPYREGITNPYNPDSPEGKSWQRQNDWFRRKRQPQIMQNEKLDKLVDQGWPKEAVDELKALGRAPTTKDIEEVRARYKGTPTSPESVDKPGWEPNPDVLQPVLGDPRRGQTQEQVDAANAADEASRQPAEPASEWGQDAPVSSKPSAETKARNIAAERDANGPFTSREDLIQRTGISEEDADKLLAPKGVANPTPAPEKGPSLLDQMSEGGKRLREAAQKRGQLDPNAPDYVPPETYPEGGVLDRMGPGGKRLAGLEDTPAEAEKPGWEPPVDTLGLEENGGLNPGEKKVEPPEQLTRADFGSDAEYEDWLHNQQSGYNEAVKSSDSDAILRSLQQQGYSQEDLDASNPYTQWTREDQDKPSQGNKMVTPPITTGGGHKPPVGPSIEDLMKPNIFAPPLPVPGGHVPVPLPKMPGGHVPGPEIKLPGVTDKGANWTPKWPDIKMPEIPHPDISLPDWLPGEGHPGAVARYRHARDYSDMLERLRQMGQGAGADEGGDDEQIAAALGLPPEQITDEIRAWWSSRPQPQPVQPGDDGMGAGLSSTMRQPIRMPSSRMEASNRAGWTPRAGGMKRRASMGTSAMVKL